MMKMLRIILFTALACLSTIGTSTAQSAVSEKDSYNRTIDPDSMFLWKQDSVRTFHRWFVTVGGGVGRLLTEDSHKLPFWKESKTLWSISAGAWITPVWGVRAQAAGGTLQGFALWTEGSGNDPGHSGGNWFLGEDHPNPIGRDRFNTYLEAAPDADPAIREFIKNNYFDLDKPRVGSDGSHGYNYHFSYYTLMADLMLNLNHAIGGYSGRENFIQVMPFAGLGLAHTRKDGILPKINNIAIRAGLMADVRVTERFGVRLESGLMMVPEVFDRFVGGDRTQDAVFSLSAGLTYKFGKTQTDCRVNRYYKYHLPAPVVILEPEPEPEPEPVIPICPGVQLSGRVYDTQNNPVAQAAVFVLDTQEQTVLVLRSDDAGMYTTLVPCGARLVIQAVKSGYLEDCFSFIAADNPTGSILEQELPGLRLARLEKDKIIALENIHYDYDKWDIRPDAAAELDKVVVFLHQNPAISVELGSHTDVRGSDAYNDRLSQRRAESAVAYITARGISSDRISAKGYGKRKLLIRNPNGTYTEEQHQANRRTEIRIVDEGTSQLQVRDPWAGYATGRKYQTGDLPAGFFDQCGFR